MEQNKTHTLKYEQSFRSQKEHSLLFLWPLTPRNCIWLLHMTNLRILEMPWEIILSVKC